MSTAKTIGGALAAIVILIASQLLAQLAAELLSAAGLPGVACNIIAGAIYALFTFVLLKVFSERLLKIKMDRLGMPKFSVKAKWIGIGFLLPAAVTAAYLLLFPGRLVPSELSGEQVLSIVSAGVFFTGIAAGFVEEMVFRGVILSLLREKWNIKAAVLIPSVLFGLAHILGTELSLPSGLLVVIAGTAVGIMFSLIEIESGSVWNGGIVHALWNIVIIGGVLTIGTSPDEYSLFTYVLDSRSFVLTGGEFGIEASIIALAGYALVGVSAAAMMKKRENALKAQRP